MAVGGGIVLVSVLLSYERRLAVLEQALDDGARAERSTEPQRARDMRRGGRGAMRGAPLDPPGVRGSVVSPSGPPRGAGHPELDRGMEEQVRGVIREERLEIEEEQREQFRAMFTERVESRMNRFAEEFDVPQAQREELTNALLSELDASMQLRNEARGGDKSIDEVREAIRGLRDQTSARAQELLTETQFDAFEDGRRGRGGGGGPPWAGGGFGRGR
jgi:hypothetical protein